MDYTGIRAVPLVTPRRIMQPHLARYVFATQVSGPVNSALDVACGTGYGISLLRNAGGGRVWGVDLDRAALNFGSDNFGDPVSATFLQADACTLPFVSDSFDLVTSFETFEHILDSHKFLAELQRIIRPTGVLVISTPHAPMFEPFSKPPDLKQDYIRLGLGHKHSFRAGEFLNMLGDHFGDVTLYGQSFRRASMLTRVARQAERVMVGAKYRLAGVALLQDRLAPFLGDVLPQGNLTFNDARWKVSSWDDPKTEPIFCVAVCRAKKS